MLGTGSNFGRFHILELLGHGGGGTVYRAHDPALDRLVALKLLDRATSASSALREARAAASIRHANVVAVYEVGEQQGVPFIVMELLHGKRLSQWMGQDPAPLTTRLRWLVEIAEALDASHAKGLVHRDIKPSNVMIGEDGTAKVFDFGIATRAVSNDDPDQRSSTDPGWIKGTPRYMSPEHLRGQPLDGRADQYAWGLIAYELLSGVPPLPDEASSPGDGFVKPLAHIEHTLPVFIVTAVTRALCPTREHRFPSMRALIDALAAEAVADTEAGGQAPSSHAEDLAVGDVVAGKYRIEKLLGRGGMGIVYRAHHLVLGQSVALKMLRGRIAANPQMVTRFVNEARAALPIQSPHVARVLDVDTNNGAPFIVLELLEGVDLDRLLKRSGPLSAITAVDYVMQVLEAIAEAHALGIVHRDLKPANIFLSRRASGGDIMKVLDFGISKMRVQIGEEPLLMTSTDHILGSPEYMSPEQIQDPSTVDARADIWAIGVILYELITGEVPFTAENPLAILNAVLTAPITPPSRIRPVLKADLEAKILRCLERDRERRFPNVLALAEALAPFGPPNAEHSLERIATISGLPRTNAPSAIVSTSDVEPLPPLPRSHGWLAAVGVGALIVLGAVGFGVRSSLRAQARTEAAPPASATTLPSAPTPIPTPEAIAPPVHSAEPETRTSGPLPRTAPRPTAPPHPSASTAKPASSYDPFAAPRTP
jgi:serine/threonine-protein kinase